MSHLIRRYKCNLNSLFNTSMFLTLAIKLLSRKILVGPASSAYGEVFFTLALRYA